MGVIFIVGIYGVGKSTICNALSSKLSIPHFSASELISQTVGEKYGVNKIVTDIDMNQQVLIKAVSKKLDEYKNIILSGHFCIFDKEQNIVELPSYVYEHLSIDIIVLLEANVEIVQKHLINRDSKIYSLDRISLLKNNEIKLCETVSKKINRLMLRHQMRYNDSDLAQISNIIYNIWR